MTDNKPAARLQTNILNKELQGMSNIAVYTPTHFVTSDVDINTSGYSFNKIINDI